MSETFWILLASVVAWCIICAVSILALGEGGVVVAALITNGIASFLSR